MYKHYGIVFVLLIVNMHVTIFITAVIKNVFKL